MKDVFVHLDDESKFVLFLSMKFSELSTSAAFVCLVNDEKFELGIHTVDATLTSSQLFTGTLFVIGIYYCFHFQIDQENYTLQ